MYIPYIFPIYSLYIPYISVRPRWNCPPRNEHFQMAARFSIDQSAANNIQATSSEIMNRRHLKMLFS